MIIGRRLLKVSERTDLSALLVGTFQNNSCEFRNIYDFLIATHLNTHLGFHYEVFNMEETKTEEKQKESKYPFGDFLITIVAVGSVLFSGYSAVQFIKNKICEPAEEREFRLTDINNDGIQEITERIELNEYHYYKTSDDKYVLEEKILKDPSLRCDFEKDYLRRNEKRIMLSNTTTKPAN